jgi:hypothetical protein
VRSQEMPNNRFQPLAGVRSCAAAPPRALGNDQRRSGFRRCASFRKILADSTGVIRGEPPRRQPGTTLPAPPARARRRAVGRTGLHFNRRLHEAPVYGFGFQFRTTVMGRVTSLSVSMRKR